VGSWNLEVDELDKEEGYYKKGKVKLSKKFLEEEKFTH